MTKRNDFLTVEGLDLRGGPHPVQPESAAPIRLVSTLPRDECGCPEEIWIVHGLIYTIHFEPDGTGEISIEGGDWDDSFAQAKTSMDHLRAAMFAHFAGLPVEK